MSGLVLFNPLPTALHHYQLALQDVCDRAGRTPSIGRWPSAELGGQHRFIAAARHLASKAFLPSNACSLLIWPSLGWLDTLKPPQGRLSVVMHDPVPLRPQPFLGPTTARLVANAPRKLLAQIIVHSEAALRVVASYGYNDVALLPHPFQSQVLEEWSRSRVVRVLGAYKPARDLGVLQRLAVQLPEWQLEIHGRGWPQVDGWRVYAEFVSEPRLAALLRTAGVVVIPYTRYFQSGIAVRALEHGIPVVGGRGTYVQELLGPGYAGLADGPGDWGSAVRRAYESQPDLAESLNVLEGRVVHDWSQWLHQVARA